MKVCRKRVIVWLLAVLTAFTIAACGGGEPDTSIPSVPETGSMDSEVSSSEQEESTETQADDNGGEVSQPVPVTKEINQTITDEELGYTITIKKAILNIPFDEDKQDLWYNGYRTGICVEVELKNDSEYTGGLYDTDLMLVVNDTTVNTNSARVSTFQTFADENSLTVCPSNGINSGETASGWLFYYFDTGEGDNQLAIRYSRQETKITTIGGADGGESTMLPAVDIDIPLSF